MLDVARMKKPKQPVTEKKTPRPIAPEQLDKVTGGAAAADDWEARI